MILEQHRYWQSQGWTPLRVIRLVNREQRRHGVDEKEYDDTGDGAFQALHDLLDLLDTPPLGMTPRQKQVFDFVDNYINETGTSPAFSDIMQGCGMSSKSQVHRVLHGLRERRLIEFKDYRTRSITVLNHD